MMGLDERLFYILLGAAIGFVLGYLTHKLQNIDRKVDEVTKIVKHEDNGFLSLPSWTIVKAKLLWLWRWVQRLFVKYALFVVVVLTVFASFQSQRVSNEVRANSNADRETQTRISRITTCNSQFLGRTILALNERTEFVTAQAKANMALQQEQLRLLTIALTIPPPTPEEGQKAVDRYVKKLKTYVDLAMKTVGKQANTKYPTLDDFTECVDAKKDLMTP